MIRKAVLSKFVWFTLSKQYDIEFFTFFIVDGSIVTQALMSTTGFRFNFSKIGAWVQWWYQWSKISVLLLKDLCATTRDTLKSSTDSTTSSRVIPFGAKVKVIKQLIDGQLLSSIIILHAEEKITSEMSHSLWIIRISHTKSESVELNVFLEQYRTISQLSRSVVIYYLANNEIMKCFSKQLVEALKNAGYWGEAYYHVDMVLRRQSYFCSLFTRVEKLLHQISVIMPRKMGSKAHTIWEWLKW